MEIVQMTGNAINIGGATIALYLYTYIKSLTYISRSMDSCEDRNRAAMTLCKKYGMQIVQMEYSGN